METLVLGTLLANTAALVVIVIALAVAYCLPDRHKTHGWAATDETK